ncbi:MAG: putative sugar nucleotidyl transferase [Gemmatimonadota bacterium]
MTHLYLIEDAAAHRWEPFARTRPIGELLFGTMLLRERVEHCLRLEVAGYVGRDALVGFEEEGSPPVLPAGSPTLEEPVMALSSRFVPPDPGTPELARLAELLGRSTGSRLRLVVGGVTAGWILPPGTRLPPLPGDGEFEAFEVAGSLLSDPWTLMSVNAARTSADLRGSSNAGETRRPLSRVDLPGVHFLGGEAVTAGSSVDVEPGCIFDTRRGPIHLGDGVRVQGPARIEGPSFFGKGSVVLGGTLSGVSCGPVCKLRGEIDSSVLLGYANKAHDGYLGHALVGRWVNLGAMTTNSDLKNNYGNVRLPLAGRDVDTGLIKVGAFLGDHVKTGIGTLLSTGSIIGAGANVVSEGLSPRSIPPFAWITPGGTTTYRKEPFLDTVERAMARRDVSLPDGMRGVLARAWEESQAGGPGAGGGCP